MTEISFVKVIGLIDDKIYHTIKENEMVKKIACEIF